MLPAVCPELIAAPRVLAVGDLHIENFGTWRDHEGRLVWGINDFDEAFPLPYTQDLVRLATSAVLGISADLLRIKPKEASAAILSGYAEGIKTAGQPFVLAERHKWLAAIALARLENPARFWRKLANFPDVRGKTPAPARKALENLMPDAGLSYKTVRRVSGLGSLGRQRFAAIADWLGGKIAREADGVIYTLAGPEISIASTKAFTAQMAALFLFALYLGQVRESISKDLLAHYIRELLDLPGKVKTLLNCAAECERIAAEFHAFDDFLFLGRAIHYPIAMDGALKLKEVSYVHAEGYATGDGK